MTPNSSNPTQEVRGACGVRVWVAVAWLIAFFIWFNSFPFPNNPGLQRLALWKSLAIPFDIIDVIDPPVVPNSAPWSWYFLLQRIPFLLLAFAVWAGAWGAGALVLRACNVRLCGCERFFFSICIGLSSISLVVLSLGLCGCMSQWLLASLLAAFLLAELILCRWRVHSIADGEATHGKSLPFLNWSRLGWIVLLVLAPFIAVQMLGAMSPQTDFDMLAYHLGGPKEWFQLGQISRLPHNVYTNFPFLSEMLILSGMVLWGDWQWGSLAGQAVVAGFAPLSAIGLFAAGRRWFSREAGCFAALVYLTSPWTYRISIYANAEGGLSCYLFASLYALLLYRDQFVDGEKTHREGFPFALLTGLMAGSAMACKYTGLITVVIPVGMLLAGIGLYCAQQNRFRQVAVAALAFSVGVAASIGPWLLKNAVETGNPVYPLAVQIFGGTDRDEVIDAKWRRAHANNYQNWNDRLKDLPIKMADVVANNDWHSPLMFGLAPLSLLACFRRRQKGSANRVERSYEPVLLGLVWFYVIWQFVVWWILTHHIDRFYVPMFTAVSLLAGVGMRWWEPSVSNPSSGCRPTVWNWCAGCVIGAAVLYNATLMARGIGGFNAGRLDLNAASNMVIAPRLKWINNEFESGHFPKNMKVLCVGEAELFHARYPYIYNTVFDHSIFERLFAEPNSPEGRLRPAAQIRDELKRLGITHIDVNWSWILRYREPHNYGYTAFASPETFAELQRIGILGPPLNLPIEAALAPLSEKTRSQLVELGWSSRLVTKVADESAFISAQVFPVRNSVESN